MAYIGVQPTAGQYRKLDNISSSFNGSTTSFTTSVGGTNVTAGTAQQLIVSLGGVIQQPDTDYTVSTSTITFTTAPAAGLDFFAILMGDALNTVTPSDGSVTTAKLAGSLSVGLAAGSVSAPSLFFTGDTNNGIYSPSTDAIAVTTAGSERLRVTSAGLVGIGTASAGHKLDLLVGGGADGVNVYNNATGAAYYQLATTSRSYKIEATGSDLRFYDNTGSAERARIDSSGRLLVGTSSARSNDLFGTSQSQVEGTDSATSSISIIRNVAATGAGGIALCKSRSSSIGGVTVVQSGDVLGFIDFQGADGTDFARAATIEAQVDGTPGNNDMPGRLVFSTTADGASSPTERMRISNIGVTNVFISSGDGIQARNAAAASTSYANFVGRYGATDTTTSGTPSFIVYTNGDVKNTNNSYTAISDAKLKENIVDANPQWDDIKALRVRNFTLKEGQTHKQIGLIAQEVEPICPGLVGESPDRDAEGNDLGTVTKSVNYSVLYMKAVKALQEAMERIETLEAKVAALESA